MTTAIRRYRLSGWSFRCLSIALVLAFGASAFADPNKNVVTRSKAQRGQSTRKVCYTYASNSAIPQPCERLGAIPTTASPMVIYGNSASVIDKGK